MLVPFDESFVTERYRRWMHSPDVTQYLESRHVLPSLDDLRAYVERMTASPDVYFFAVVNRETREHLGNLKLGPVDSFHLRSPIGVVVGEPSAWGRGIATEAIGAVSDWAFNVLGLYKLAAGSYSNNIGSIRAFQKAGFRIEGELAGNVVLADGSRGDAVVLGRTAE